MTLPAIFDPFAKGAAATVMTRMALEWLVDDAALDQLFEDQAQAQYTRELTLSHMVNLMLDVASGVRPSPRAAFEARWEQLRVSAVAFYGKLKRMEPEVTAAVARPLAGRARGERARRRVARRTRPRLRGPHPRRQRPGRDR